MPRSRPLALRFPEIVAHGRRQLRPKSSNSKFDLGRPDGKSDFTYYGPGDLIENSGWKKMPGRVDYHVYSRMRFPIADAPGYVKSQSFMPGATATTPEPWDAPAARARNITAGSTASRWCSTSRRRKTSPIHGAIISASSVIFLVGQCPGGYGHQGEDIRPEQLTSSTMRRPTGACPISIRLPPYMTAPSVACPEILASISVANTENERVRFRYLHINPNTMDAEGLLNGKRCPRARSSAKSATGATTKGHLVPHPLQHPGLHQNRLGIGSIPI